MGWIIEVAAIPERPPLMNGRDARITGLPDREPPPDLSLDAMADDLTLIRLKRERTVYTILKESEIGEIENCSNKQKLRCVLKVCLYKKRLYSYLISVVNVCLSKLVWCGVGMARSAGEHTRETVEMSLLSGPLVLMPRCLVRWGQRGGGGEFHG